VQLYHSLDWKPNDAKKQDWVRVGEGMIFTMYGKQMSQYFQKPPAVTQMLPLKV